MAKESSQKKEIIKPVMKIENFFENLKALFSDEESDSAEIKASVYRNVDGEIEEIRIFNEEYDEFLVVEKSGNLTAINIKEYMEK